MVKSCIVPFTNFLPVRVTGDGISPAGSTSPLSQPAGFSARVAAQVAPAWPRRT
jgi:hypothetical protein